MTNHENQTSQDRIHSTNTDNYPDSADDIKRTEDGSNNGFSFDRRSFLKILGVVGIVGAIPRPTEASSTQTRDTDNSNQITDRNNSFDLLEATVADIRTAIITEQITARAVTEQYLERIEAYEDEINAFITINSEALERAEALDARYAESGPVGPLHGIPIVLKDNYDTGTLPTTAGCVVFDGSLPPDDAFTVSRFQDAGGIILAKANMHEFAFGYDTISSLGGQTKNPYALERVPGGSSGGTGAAIAANIGVIGTGTDTCGSIRVPSAWTSLVGLRPTMGLISRAGIIPLSLSEDTAGPMTRTVSDTAVALDVMVGYDSDDPETARLIGNTPQKNYTSFLNIDGLTRARIGVLRDLFGLLRLLKMLGSRTRKRKQRQKRTPRR